MTGIVDSIDELEAVAIEKVLDQVVPLESAVVGKTTVARLVRGQQFESTKGGHHMDVTVAVGLVAAAATIVHYTWIIGVKTAEKWKSRESKAMKTEVVEQVRTELELAENLQQALSENPQLLSDVYDALNKLHEFREIVSTAVDATSQK